MTPNGRQVLVQIPSRLELLDMLQSVAEQTAQIVGFSDDAQVDFGLAVREAAINAMKHGHGLNPDVHVEVRFTTEVDLITALIVDQGNGFEPQEVPDPTQSENIWRESGRGLMLIRSLVDEVVFERGAPGMRVMLRKQLVVKR